MSGFFALLCVICSVLLIAAVVIQNSKGGGLSSAFVAGNISSMIGAKRGNDMIEKITWWLIGLVMGLAFLANLFLGSADVKAPNSRFTAEDIEAAKSEMPAMPEQAPANPGAQPAGQPAGQPAQQQQPAAQ